MYEAVNPDDRNTNMHSSGQFDLYDPNSMATDENLIQWQSTCSLKPLSVTFCGGWLTSW